MDSAPEPEMPQHPKDLAEQKYEQAIAAIRSGDLSSAKQLLQESASAAVNFKTFERLGEIARSEGNLEQATIMLGAAVGIGVNQAKSRFLLAEVLRARSEPYSAAMKLVEALRINPNYRKAAELLAELRTEHPWLEEQLRE